MARMRDFAAYDWLPDPECRNAHQSSTLTSGEHTAPPPSAIRVPGFSSIRTDHQDLLGLMATPRCVHSAFADDAHRCPGQRACTAVEADRGPLSRIRRPVECGGRILAQSARTGPIGMNHPDSPVKTGD